MDTFKNIEMKNALKLLRTEENDITVQNAIDTLMKTQLLAPAQWDKDPVKNEKGQMVFEPNTKFQLLVIESSDGKLYFPMFTEMAELEKWKLEDQPQSLVMSFDQYMPFVEMSKDNVEGIVINPFTENVPFLAPRLIQLKQAKQKNSIHEKTIQQNEVFDMRSPVANVDDLKKELEKVGQENETIQAIYLQERLVKNEPSHWFVIVDMDPEDTKIFQGIAARCKPHAKGKALEFIFGSANVAINIKESIQPIYQR